MYEGHGILDKYSVSWRPGRGDKSYDSISTLVKTFGKDISILLVITLVCVFRGSYWSRLIYKGTKLKVNHTKGIVVVCEVSVDCTFL